MPKIKNVKKYDVIIDRTKATGNSSHIILPLEWLDKKVMVIKMGNGKKKVKK
jgi:hypothetical protein